MNNHYQFQLGYDKSDRCNNHIGHSGAKTTSEASRYH